MRVTYRSNYSDGSWWLGETEWAALTAAGWRRDAQLPNNGSSQYVWKEFPDIRSALQEFERVTGQDVTASGCHCCGPPHDFLWQDEHASGEDLLPYLYEEVPRSMREACEKLNKGPDEES